MVFGPLVFPIMKVFGAFWFWTGRVKMKYSACQKISHAKQKHNIGNDCNHATIVLITVGDGGTSSSDNN